MLEQQKGRCLICLEPITDKAVDHVHGTKVVRGILDRACNLGLGKFADDPIRLRRAAVYVETQGRFDNWEPGIGAGLL